MTDHAFDTNVEGLKAALADRYVIERELGQGGMATVFLAQDVKHDRKVALKLLKPELGAIVGGDRFLAEIRTTANLQHPNILPLFDSGESDGMLFYVMPYVEGESLRGRIDREKQLSIAEAIRLTDRIADALDYAHENGVVHRDIKPANILVTERGEPLVADFGIALAVSQAGGGRITETGLSLGTPHYMSPEQATGDRDIDPRSDIYSLGCMLYEMLAGQPPFAAPTAQGVLVRILTEHPRSVSDFRHTVPPHVGSVISRALEKLPADRFETAAEFKSALADESFRYTAVPQPTVPTTPATQPVDTAATPAAGGGISTRTVGALGGALLVALIAAGLGWMRTPPDPDPVPIVRSDVDVGDLLIAPIPNEIVISPDGSRLAVSLSPEGGGRAGAQIHVRGTDEADFRAIPGTEEGLSPLFSPDGLWIAYVTTDGLAKVSVDGGAPQPLLTGLENPFIVPTSWTTDGWIYLGSVDGIGRVRATGGAMEVIHAGVLGQNTRPLPGSSGLLFNNRAGDVVFLDLEADSSSVVVSEALDATFVEATGHLVWVDHASVMWAAPFDPESGRLTGERAFLLDGISTGIGVFAYYSISRNGTLVYSTGPGQGGFTAPPEQLEIVDLDGSVTPIELEPRTFNDPRWSPDGTTIAYSGRAAGETTGDLGVYLYDLELQTTPRHISGVGSGQTPAWSRDGTRVAFALMGEDSPGVFVRDVESDEPPRQLHVAAGAPGLTDWPADDMILFTNRIRGAPRGVRILDPTAGDSGAVSEYYAPEARALGGRVSPDGTLAVYQSQESGEFEVYVRSFPTPRAEIIVSEGGGSAPQWSADGTTIYYQTPGDSIFAARLQLEPTPMVLSREPIMAAPFGQWQMHPDGDRLLAVRALRPTEEFGGDPIEPRHFIVTNWFQELRERTGGGN
jgi:serine/threonine-protein kinase